MTIAIRKRKQPHSSTAQDCKFNRMLFDYCSNQILSLTISLTFKNLDMESGFPASWVGDFHLRNGAGGGLNQGLLLSSMEPCGLTGKAPHLQSLQPEHLRALCATGPASVGSHQRTCLKVTEFFKLFITWGL